MRIINTLLACASLSASMLAYEALATDVIVSGRDPVMNEKVGTIPADASLLILSNATVNSTASAPLPVTPNADLAGWLSAVAANAGTSNLITGFNFTPDNVLYSTTLPLSITNALNGTNPTVAFFIINRTNFAGVKSIRWDRTSTTQTNLVTVTGITFRFLYP